eukprot:gene16618-25486_t
MHPTLPDVEKPSSPPRAVDEGVTHDRGGPQDETAKAAPKVQLLSRVSGMMHAGLELAFTKLTTVVVNHPVITIIISVLVALTLAQGVWLYEEELSPDKSYTPRDSQAVVEQEWVERVFGNEKRRLEIYVTSTGDNMLTRESLTFMFEYQQAIENELSTIVEGVVVNYNTICGRHEKDGPCQKPDSVLSLWGNNITTFEEDADFMATINSDTAWRQVKPTGPGARHYLGGVATTNQTVVTGAKVARLVYRLRNEKQKISGKEDNDLQSYKFELALVEYSRGTVASEGKSLGIEVHVIAESDIDETSNEAMSSDVTSFLDVFISYLENEHPTWTDPNTGLNVSSTYTMLGEVFVTSAIFFDALKVFTSPATAPLYAFDYMQQVRWNEQVDSLVSVRIGLMIITEALEDGEVAVDAMDSLRDTCTRIRVPAGARQPFPWSFAFVFFEGFKVIVTEITRNVLIAGLCVLLLVTVLLANIFMGLIVAVIIGAIDTCMLGYMPWLGVELNSVSVICIMIAIGIAVDYSVHIAHAFLLVSASDQEFASSRAQRAAYALWKMGPAVFNGGFSTFLAILPLALAKSYVFTVFFRMFSVIIVSGQFFGVLVLPMFLSLVGPPPNADAINLDESSWLNPLSPDFDHTPIGKGLDNTGPAVQAES